MGLLTKTIHVGFDLIVISTALAGIKRNTGLTLKTEKFTDNKEIQGYIESYLGVGERAYDVSVGFLGASEYFVRK